HRDHLLQLGKTRQFEACCKLWTTAQKNAQRPICRTVKQLNKIRHDVAAKPFSVIDHKYGRPNPIVALHRPTKPAQPCRPILAAAAGYLQYFSNYGNKLIEDEPGLAAPNDKMAGCLELAAKTPKKNSLSGA